LGLFWIGCSGNGHVEQKPFVAQAGDDVVNCACNLTFDNEHCTGGTCNEHFELQLCLPPALQRSQGTDGGTDDYAKTIDQYCRQVVTNTVYHLITVFNGSWCQYKAPYAPNGGVGSSVECFAQPLSEGKASATGRDDGTCETPCREVDCDYHANCGEGVQDQWGTPDLHKCQCSRIVDQGWCPGDNPNDIPTPLFCRPPDGASIQ
jgi:hypothetical protein